MSQILSYSIAGISVKKMWLRQAFQVAYAGQWWRILWLRLLGKNGRLLDLNHLKKKMSISASTPLGIQLVPIASIVGSEGRSREFTADFRPLKTRTMERWIRVANARVRNMPLPPVELILIDNAYFVRDGHHRLSVARHFGQTDIEATVTRWVVDTLVYTDVNKLEIDWQLLDRLQIR